MDEYFKRTVVKIFAAVICKWLTVLQRDNTRIVYFQTFACGCDPTTNWCTPRAYLRSAQTVTCSMPPLTRPHLCSFLSLKDTLRATCCSAVSLLQMETNSIFHRWFERNREGGKTGPGLVQFLAVKAVIHILRKCQRGNFLQTLWPAVFLSMTFSVRQQSKAKLTTHFFVIQLCFYSCWKCLTANTLITGIRMLTLITGLREVKELLCLALFLSGFKTRHSTELALVRVYNDIFMANDSVEHVVLALLNLNASAFHNILLSRLQHQVST